MYFTIIDAQTYNNGKIGAIVEMIIDYNESNLCDIEKSDLYAFTKEILYQIATSSPLFISYNDVPDSIIHNFKDKLFNDLRKKYFLSNNHTERAELHIEKQINKGVEHLLTEYYKETCLLSQPFIKDKTVTVQSLIEEKSISIGKTIQIKRFERYDIKKEFEVKIQYPFDIPLEYGIPLEIFKEKCPKCGCRLVHVTYGSSDAIICERHGCYRQNYFGI